MSRLLGLPKELRLQIYEHVFALELPTVPSLDNFSRTFGPDSAQQHGHIVIGGRPARPWQCRPDPFHPSLLQVSSIIRNEALPLLYKDRTVVLVLRYREGRTQLRQWLNVLAGNQPISDRVRYVSIQYFEDPHRSTAVLVDLHNLVLLNKSCLRHPQTSRAPVLVQQLDDILIRARMTYNGNSGHQHFATVLRELSATMTAVIWTSSLRYHSIVNIRLHGYSDFGQRFEVLHILYNGR